MSQISLTLMLKSLFSGDKWKAIVGESTLSDQREESTQEGSVQICGKVKERLHYFLAFFFFLFGPKGYHQLILIEEKQETGTCENSLKHINNVFPQ